MTVLPVLYMIFSPNIVRAAYAFALSLLGLAAIYVMLHAEFMAAVQIMVYAGGVIVLLIFGIMITKRNKTMEVSTRHRNVAAGSVCAALLFGLMARWILGSGLIWEGEKTNVDQVRAIGVAFLTEYILSFEIIAFLLLTTLVGAAFLAKKMDSR